LFANWLRRESFQTTGIKKVSGDRKLFPEEWYFILALVGALKESGIVCPILRNYETLPDRVGNDIDVFIPRSELKRAEGIFKKHVSLHSGVLVKKYQKDTFMAWWVRIGNAPLLHIDLFNGAFFWRGRCFELDESVSETTREHSLGITVPRPSHQAFSMFITSLIWGGFYKSKYGTEICQLLSDKEELRYFNGMMKTNFPKAFPIPFDFVESPDARLIKEYTKNLRGNLKWRWLRKCNLIEMYRVMRFWWWEILSLWNPSGRWCLVDDSMDVSEDNLLISDPLNLYGAVLEYSYQKESALSWIWFRLRHLQRRMARNELILVKVPLKKIAKIFDQVGGYPDFIMIGNNADTEFISKNGAYFQYSTEHTVWEKSERKRAY